MPHETHEPSNGELKGLIIGLGTQLTSLSSRVTKLEEDRDHMRGDLLREVGGVHKALDRQDKELGTQTKQLNELIDDKKTQTKQLNELIDDKKTLKAYAKAVTFTVVAAPGLWMFIKWGIEHIKL